MEDLEECETLISERPSRLVPRRALLAGALALGVFALAGAALHGTSVSSTGASTSGLDMVILRSEEAPKCEKEDEVCHGCSGMQCSSCRKTVQLKCCVAEAKTDDAKKACCENEDYVSASKDGVCDVRCQTFDEACKGCGGEQCSHCRKTVDLRCCVAKAKAEDEKKACCENEDYNEAIKEGSCNSTEAPKPAACSAAGEGCLQTGCCKDKDLTCFTKNEHWADCKRTCEAGKIDPNSPKDLQSPWSCDTANATKCSKAGDGCLKTGCCQDSTTKCFVKNDHWADCKKTCEPGKVDPNSPKDEQSPWNCTEMNMTESK